MLQGDELASLVAQHEAIVHLAAQTGVASSVADPMGDFDINAAGTLRVLEACRQAGPKRKRLVFASSNAVIGRQPPPATEEAAPMPTSPYGASKLAGEGYCLAYGHCWPIDPVVLRLGNVYGPCSHHKGSVVARFFKDILTRGELTIDGDGTQTRDLVFVEDVCCAIISALESPDAVGEVIQIGSGVGTSIAALAGLAARVSGRQVDIQFGRARRGEVQSSFSRIEKARTLLAWTPRVGLEAGLSATWSWFEHA
jgi:UDP-glucose 4-epimerase